MMSALMLSLAPTSLEPSIWKHICLFILYIHLAALLMLLTRQC